MSAPAFVSPHAEALFHRLATRTARTGVIGLGYVGLPLAVEFGKTLDVLGYDIDVARVAELLPQIEADSLEMQAVLS